MHGSRHSRFYIKWAIASVIVFSISIGKLTEPQCAPCPSIVVIKANESIRTEISEELRQFGISTKPKSKCPAIIAIVKKVDNGYVLEVLGAGEDYYAREVSNSHTVAVLIDALIQREQVTSWLQYETLSPKEPQTKKKPVHPSSTNPHDSTLTVKPTQKFMPIDATFETSLGFDRTLWMGGRVGACVQWGPICLGLQLRFAFDSRLAGPSKENQTHRALVNGGLFAHLIFESKRLAFYPGLGIGAGWIGTWVLHHDETGELIDDVEESGGFRLDLFGRLAIHLTDKLALLINASTGFSFPAETKDMIILGEKHGGEPRGLFRGGIGLRYKLSYGN